MRRRSVAQTDSTSDRARVAADDPAARIATALTLGRRDIERYAAAAGIDHRTARLLVERRRQARRRPSACMDALLR